MPLNITKSVIVSTNLILNGLIANFKSDEMLEGLEERLVEVEVDELGGVLHE